MILPILSHLLLTLFTWVWWVALINKLSIIYCASCALPRHHILGVAVQWIDSLSGATLCKSIYNGGFAFIISTTDRLIRFFGTITVTSSAAFVCYCICKNKRVIVRTIFPQTDTSNTIFIPFRSASRYIDFFVARQYTGTITTANFTYIATI